MLDSLLEGRSVSLHYWNVTSLFAFLNQHVTRKYTSEKFFSILKLTYSTLTSKLRQSSSKKMLESDLNFPIGMSLHYLMSLLAIFRAMSPQTFELSGKFFHEDSQFLLAC